MLSRSRRLIYAISLMSLVDHCILLVCSNEFVKVVLSARPGRCSPWVNGDIKHQNPNIMIKIYSSNAVDPGTLFAISQPPCHVTLESELSTDHTLFYDPGQSGYRSVSQERFDSSVEIHRLEYALSTL